MPPSTSAYSSNLLSMISASGAASNGLSSALLGVRSPSALFMSILQSRTVQEALVDRFDLLRRYKKHYVEDACKELAANTRISEELKTGVITISVDATDPILASKIAQAYVEELDRVTTKNNTSAARRERIFLEGRLKDIKQDLDASSAEISQFSTKNKAFDISSQAKATVDAGMRLKADLATARAQLAALRQSYTADNVRVRAVEAQVNALQDQVDKLIGNSVTRSTAGEDETATSDYPSLTELPALELATSDLDRRVRVDELLWETLTKQYEAAKVEEEREIPTVRFLDPPSVPQRKSFPPRTAIVLLGTMLSFFTGCILLLVSSYWQQLDPQDERRLLVADIRAQAFKAKSSMWDMPVIRSFRARKMKQS